MVHLQRQIVSPVMVGRAQELAVLEPALETARQWGRCVLIAGEAGVGKSRLIAEVCHHARKQQVLKGHAFEQDRAFPYAPLIDLLRTFFARRQKSEILEMLGPLGHEIVKLLPELRTFLQPSAALEPEAEKRRLCEALVQFLTQLYFTRP
jgi:predicted ATPase